MQRLTYYERQIIESGLRVDKSVRAIAMSIGRDHRVVQREVLRNAVSGRPYSAVSAEMMARVRQKKKNVHKLELERNKDLKEYVLLRLKEDWSPEQIEGVLKTQRPEEASGKTICYESIYDYIYNGSGRYEQLFLHLRKGRARRQKRHSRKPHKTSIPERVSIHERPEEVNERITYGHWESDSVLCGQNSNEKLSVQYERKSQLLRLHKIYGMSAKET